MAWKSHFIIPNFLYPMFTSPPPPLFSQQFKVAKKKIQEKIKVLREIIEYFEIIVVVLISISKLFGRIKLIKF